MSFQDNLRMYRERLGVNAKDFAAQLGIKYTTYAGYENQGKEPKYETLCKIAAALHVSIDELVGYEPNRLQYWIDTFQKVMSAHSAHLEEYLPGKRDIVAGVSFSAQKDGDQVSIMCRLNNELFELEKLNKDDFVKLMTSLDKKVQNELNEKYTDSFARHLERWFMAGLFFYFEEKITGLTSKQK